MDERLTTLLRELYDEGGTHLAPPFPAAEMRSRRRLNRRWTVAAGAAVAAAVVVTAVTLTNGTNNTARLVPVEGPITSSAEPSPSTSATPSPAPSVTPTTVPSSVAASPAGGVNPPTGINSQGPQISGTRWMNVNAWVDRLTPTTYLTVYAGGATIDPSLQSDTTQAAVLVITPADTYKFDHGQVPRDAIGTIYRAPGSPVGKLRVTAATGNLVTLTLIGTSQTYVFNDTTMTFQ